MKTSIIELFHGYDKGKKAFGIFLDNLGRALGHESVTFGLHAESGEYFYSVSASEKAYDPLESQFYTSFGESRLAMPGKRDIGNYGASRAVGVITLKNEWFYPFKTSETDETGFVSTLFRTFENFNIETDKFGFFVSLKPIENHSRAFYARAKLSFLWFRFKMVFRFFQYIFTFKKQSNWREIGAEYFEHKLHEELFETRIWIVCSSTNRSQAESRIRTFFNAFKAFENFPYNNFTLEFQDPVGTPQSWIEQPPFRDTIFSGSEISEFFHFPTLPKNETALLKIKARKLALPIGIPLVQSRSDQMLTTIWVTDYRSIRAEVGIHDEDRLRHIYAIGKTWVGKSKFLLSLIRNDIVSGKWLAVIDPHGDLLEEAMMFVPEERKKDVIIFDPTDTEFPFCFNPLDIKSTESKQILARGFIDIFKKFFGANWNVKLEHVLRMIFLGLLEKKWSTLFDVIRVLTDKDFRYEMIDAVQDSVVRNFWTNEFAGWSQQFNSEAIMPILNKVGQLLSVDMIKNLFESTENRLDFRAVMDEKKILFIKLPKGKLQSEVMGFLGAIFVTKLYQAAMWRQGTDKSDRSPFFLYVDEFQNFATDTFEEILSEARKYGLGLAIAHQFLDQVPRNIQSALFGNVGTLVSFRISSEDSIAMTRHFDPFVTPYDLANLNQWELYIKMLVGGQVKDPFSLKTQYISDQKIDRNKLRTLYDVSRREYARQLANKTATTPSKKSSTKKIEFAEPLL